MKNRSIKQLTPMLLGLTLIVGFGCSNDGPSSNPIVMTPTGSLRGQVEQIEGVQISVRVLQGSKVVAETEADADGNYQVDSVEIGEHTLEIAARGYETINLTAQVIADQTVSMNPVVLQMLTTPVAHIRGLLTDQGTKQTLVRVRVQLIDVQGRIREAMTSQAGVFEFENLPVNQRFTLVVDLDGYEKQEINIRPIPADQTQKVTVDLVPILMENELLPGEGLSIGTKAPTFDLPDGDERVHSFSDYVGQKRVVLVFYRGDW